MTVKRPELTKIKARGGFGVQENRVMNHQVRKVQSNEVLGRLNVARVTCALLFSGIFALSFFAAIQYNVSFVHVTNESLSYRFFLCERAGEGGAVWLPQGQLLSFFQCWIYCAIDWFAGLPNDDLRIRSNLFGLSSLALNAAGMTTVQFWAALRRRAKTIECCVLLLPALVPVFAMGVQGYLLNFGADYYSTNVVLSTAVAVLCVDNWSRRDERVSTVRAFCCGLFIGALTANKITMTIPAIVAMAPLLVGRSSSGLQCFRVCSFAVLGTLCAVLTVLIGIYGCSYSAIVEMLQRWTAAAFCLAPEMNFWESGLDKYVRCIVAIAFSIGALSLFAISCFRKIDTSFKARLVFLCILLVATFINLFAIAKRPAGQTLYESATILLAYAAIALVLTSEQWKIGTAISCAVLGAWSIYMIACHPHYQEWVRTSIIPSAAIANAKWKMHYEILAMADGKHILVIHPNNDHHYEGIHEFLLKGACEFPTWQISESGRRVINRYAQGLSFRSDGTSPPLNAPIAPGQIVIWTNGQLSNPPFEKYKSLRTALETRRGPIRTWTVQAFGGNLVEVFAFESGEVGRLQESHDSNQSTVSAHPGDWAAPK